MDADPMPLERFRSLIAERFGLAFDDSKTEFLSGVLRRRLDATHSASIDEYARALDDRASRERATLVDQITVGETFFFRNPDNFRALAKQVLPECVRRRGGQRTIRILSAGCASGEEPYSLAIVLRESIPNLAAWDVEIRGLDLNARVLEKAATGRFSKWSLRATDENARRRYFRQDGREFLLEPSIRDLVTFEQRNLADDDPSFWQSARFDVVFCRNVIMYFTLDVMQRVIGRFHRVLLPGGYLFLGHAETLRGISSEFSLLHTHDTFYYQRCESGDAPERDTTVWLADDRPSESVVVDPSIPWFDAIRDASLRIAALTTRAKRTLDHGARSGVQPSRPSGSPPTLAAVVDALRSDRIAKAFELFSAVSFDERNTPGAKLLHAVLLTNMGRVSEAEQVAAGLLERNELRAGAHYVMALCREHADDVAAAVEHDRMAADLDDTFAMPRLHRGLLLRRMGDTSGARNALGKALDLLQREDTERLLLFGGGFTRLALVALCRGELEAMDRCQ